MNHCFFDLETLGAERKFCDYYHCPTLFNIQETEEIKAEELQKTLKSAVKTKIT